MEHNKFTEEQMIAISILSTPDRNGLTMKEIAEKSGVSYATLARWRNNENFINEIKKHNPEYESNKFTEGQMIAISILSTPDRNGLMMKEIAEKSGVSYQTLFRWTKDENFVNEIKKHNPEYTADSHTQKREQTKKREQAINLLAEKKLSLYEICETLGISEYMLKIWRKDESFMKEVLKLNPLYYEESLSDVQLEIIELLSEPKRLSYEKIAEKFNISHSLINYWLKNNLFNSELEKKTREKMINNPYNSKFSDVQLEAIQLLAHHKKKNLSLKEIAKELNINTDKLWRWRKDQDFLDAIKEAEENDNNLYLSPLQISAINLVSTELTEKNTLYDIAWSLRIPYSTLKSWLKNEDIKNLVIKSAQDNNIPLEKTPFSLLSTHKRKDEMFDEANMYSKEQVFELLSINIEFEFQKIMKRYSIPFTYYNDSSKKGPYKFYSKEEVDNLVVIQKRLLSDYISANQIKDMLSGTDLTFNSNTLSLFKGEKIPDLLRPFYKMTSVLYKKDDVLAWKDKQLLKISLDTISLDNSYETFLYRLEIKEKLDGTLYLNNFGPFTKESWLSFVRTKLKTSTSSEITLNQMINKFSLCTLELNEFLESKKSHEIYSFTSNDINLFFNRIVKTHAKMIYLYLKDISDKYEEVRNRSYKIDNINNPFEIPPAKKFSKEIYDYKTFKDVMIFCNDISFQKKRAINSSIRGIEGHKEPKYYESSWLYVLMHLNNAWRNGDVITFPRISLKGTSIVDLEWLKENDISPTDADFIVNQIQRKDFTISKTQVKNHFFISDELKLAFATAAAICELRVQKLNPLRTNLIDFGNKINEFEKNRRRNFFKELDNEDFVFGSRKMNRTLMSYIYSILSKMKGNEYALKVVQNMRGHVDEETTLIYVDLAQEDVDDLTKQLFDRGSFGFIYDTFIDFINGVELDRDKRTLEIQILKNNFGSLEKVEHLSGFINSIQQERQVIMDTIYSLGLEKAKSFVNQIHANLMLGKDRYTQCLVYKSEGCLKPPLACLNCVYSIPNYYTLSTLAGSLERRLEAYLGMVNPEDSNYNANYNERRKYTRLLYTELETFFEATDKYEGEVFNFLSISKEEFREKLRSLPASKKIYELE